MIFEIALACGITLLLYLLLKRTLLRWKKQMEEQTDQCPRQAQHQPKEEQPKEREEQGREDDPL